MQTWYGGIVSNRCHDLFAHFDGENVRKSIHVLQTPHEMNKYETTESRADKTL